MEQFFNAHGIDVIAQDGASSIVLMEKPPATASILALPSPNDDSTVNDQAHNGPVTLVIADLSGAGTFTVEVGTVDDPITTFTAERRIGYLQSSGPTVFEWLMRVIPTNKAVRLTTSAAGSRGHLRTNGKMVRVL